MKTPIVCSPVSLLYSSCIQAIICPFVFTSGAGTSTFSPKYFHIPLTQPLDSCSNSLWDNSEGSTVIPPFPPPYGIPVTWHLILIQIDRAFTSSALTFWWNLIPPLKGPTASLWADLYPLNVFIDPSSILTGIEISIILWGSFNNSYTAGSNPNASHASFTFACALNSGFKVSLLILIPP